MIAIALGLSTVGTGAAFAAAMPPGATVMPAAAAEAVGTRWLTTVQATEDADWRATREIIRQVQRTLTDMGYDPGPIDGDMGPSTRRAIEAYQKENEIEVDGRVTEALVAALEKDLQGENGDGDGDDGDGNGEAANQQTATPAAEPEVEITDDPSSYDLGDLSDLNTFD
jgi:peptidoglycan hydrolase-like protein with peptidoglycan-binding domain